MIKMYGIASCGSVKKAVQYFKEKAIAFEFIDFKKEPISAQLLEEWLKQKPLEELVNKKGTTFRTLNPDEKAAMQDLQKAKKLILQKNNLIKRPVLMKNKKIAFIGFDIETYSSIF